MSYPCLSFLLTSNTQKPAVKLPATAKTLKRKEPTGDTVTAENASIDVTDMLRQLKEHLSCAKHGGRWCYVSPIDGQHWELDIFVLTLLSRSVLPIGNGRGRRRKGVGRARGKWQLLLASS